MLIAAIEVMVQAGLSAMHKLVRWRTKTRACEDSFAGQTALDQQWRVMLVQLIFPCGSGRNLRRYFHELIIMENMAWDALFFLDIR